ncbi:hypothetical protein VF21_09384 [Pseudogymnoascus sp. 05NY08]|nr:hypothetical protein VF21_09384 [Pseudogymnoascus sp. 05NY08]
MKRSSEKKILVFHQTASQGKTQEMKELLQTSGINVNICNRDGVTALHLAASCRKFGAMRILLYHQGIRPNACDKRGKTALHLAVSAGYLAGIKQLRRQPGIDINIQDEDGRTPLHDAVESRRTDRIKVLEALLETPGINVNVNDNYQRTALSWAVEFRYRDIALIIISSSNVSEDIQNSTMLHRVSQWGDTTIMQALANQNDTSFNAQDPHGRTPLHYASALGFHDIVEIILRTKPNLSLRDRAGKAAVELAADNRHEKAFVQLLQAEPATSISGLHDPILQWLQNDLAIIQNDTSIMLLQWATSEGWIDVATLLLRTNYRHYYYIRSKMASHRGLGRRIKKMIKRLARNGIDLESMDDIYSVTLLLLARKEGNHNMVMLLLEEQVVLKMKSRFKRLKSPKRNEPLPDWDSRLNTGVLSTIEETEEG